MWRWRDERSDTGDCRRARLSGPAEQSPSRTARHAGATHDVRGGTLDDIYSSPDRPETGGDLLGDGGGAAEARLDDDQRLHVSRRIAEAPPPAEVVLTLDAVVAQAGDFRVGPLSAQVARGERIALVGANGSGKSTLLAAVLGRRAAESGRLSWGARTRVGVLDQERTGVSGERGLGEVVGEALGWTDAADVRTLLAKFGLGSEHVARACSSLSLGERTRPELAILQGRSVNVLVLDEPTNHADVEVIEQLSDALVAFSGTVLIVTHDQALADAVAPTASWLFGREGDRASVRVVR